MLPVVVEVSGAALDPLDSHSDVIREWLTAPSSDPSALLFANGMASAADRRRTFRSESGGRIGHSAGHVSGDPFEQATSVLEFLGGGGVRPNGANGQQTAAGGPWTTVASLPATPQAVAPQMLTPSPTSSLFDSCSAWQRPPAAAVHRSASEMDLNARRQIDDFEELIRKIDRLNDMRPETDGPPFGARGLSGQVAFSLEQRRHGGCLSSGNSPNLTALLARNEHGCSDAAAAPNNAQSRLDRASKEDLGFAHHTASGCRSHGDAFSAIDDDLEVLLQQDPALLDMMDCDAKSTSDDGPRHALPSYRRTLAEGAGPVRFEAVGGSMVKTEFGSSEGSICGGQRALSASDHVASSGSSSRFVTGGDGACGRPRDRSEQAQQLCQTSVVDGVGEGSVAEDSQDGMSGVSLQQQLASPVPTRYFGPPTSLKSATMTTRTNLKQLLQMQQFHEMERKEQSKTTVTSGSPSGTSSAVSVPMQTILPSRMEVPCDVLKVHSRLENPTRYHVQENRKRQVQEYLSTTQGSTRSILVQSVPNAVAGMTSVASAAVTSTALGGASALHLSSSAPSPDSPNSVGLSSSAATSVTSDADVIESIMQLESGMDTERAAYMTSTLLTTANFMDALNGPAAKSCPEIVPTDSADGMLFSNVQLHAIAKDRQKKDNHNMIERRRRFNINDRIKELGGLLPKSNDPYYDMIRVDRQNKGTILKATVDYVKHMKREMDRLKMELGEKDQENRKLRFQNVQLAALNAQSNGSSGVDMNWPESLSSVFMKHEIKIKEEPSDTSSDRMQSPPFDDMMDEDEPVHGDPMLSSSMLGNAL